MRRRKRKQKRGDGEADAAPHNWNLCWKESGKERVVKIWYNHLCSDFGLVSVRLALALD